MFLGIDIGTSGVKAVVLDEHGAVVGQGTAALTVQRP
ncbi:FGGY family carbohydrate kinase, partial [uncultured Sphingomonas sp.]